MPDLRVPENIVAEIYSVANALEDYQSAMKWRLCDAADAVRALAAPVQPVATEPEAAPTDLDTLLMRWCDCHRDGTTKDLLRAIVVELTSRRRPVAESAGAGDAAELAALRELRDACEWLLVDLKRNAQQPDEVGNGYCDLIFHLERALGLAAPEAEATP